MTETLWKCPKCGREFKRAGQGHYCGAKPGSVGEYIAAQDEEKRPDLERIRAALKKALPEAEERISWSMPTYWKGRNIIHFAASKKYIGLYPGEEAVAFFKEELSGYSTDKGTVRIPYGNVDTELVGKIAAWCFEDAGNE